jgi:hypothetical protein
MNNRIPLHDWVEPSAFRLGIVTLNFEHRASPLGKAETRCKKFRHSNPTAEPVLAGGDKTRHAVIKTSDQSSPSLGR